MKRLLTSSFALIAMTFATMAQGKAEIKFAESSHNFGTIREADGPVSTEFIFENTGDAPLVIVSATASCGCTKPEYPKSPLRPGEKGVIKVTDNPAGRPGEFNKTITVRTPDKRVKLKIKGNVIPKN